MDLLKIKEMIEQGISHSRIANNLKLSLQEIQKISEDNKLSLKKEVFQEDQIPVIIDLYKNGVSIHTLGTKYSIDRKRITKWVKNSDVPLRDRDTSHRITFFNEHIFDQIDTEEKAYWLGFCYADAYNSQSVNTFSLTLATKDLGHVEKFTRFVGLPLENIVTECVGGYWSSNIKLYSKHICQQMAKLGCPQAKSFIIKYPDFLSDDLHRPFIRGMFDGDGCLTLRKPSKEWKWSIVSTKEYLEVLSTLIEEKVGLKLNFESISKTDNNTYCMECNGNQRILQLCDWLWESSNSLTTLDRKYQKYQDLIEQQKNRKFLTNYPRDSYLISDLTKEQIKIDYPGLTIEEICSKYKIHRKTIEIILKK